MSEFAVTKHHFALAALLVPATAVEIASYEVVAKFAANPLHSVRAIRVSAELGFVEAKRVVAQCLQDGQ